MRVITETCSRNGSSGTVKDNSDLTVDIFINVQYLDDNGTIIDDGLDSIDRVRPGETANWEDERFSELSDLANCRAEASSVFESYLDSRSRAIFRIGGEGLGGHDASSSAAAWGPDSCPHRGHDQHSGRSGAHPGHPRLQAHQDRCRR